MPIEIGCNHDKPVIRVRHADLERVYEDTLFKSNCPTCKEGLMLVFRKEPEFRLSRYDHCVVCGQRYFYTDDTIGGERLAEPLDSPVELSTSASTVFGKLMADD